LDLPDVRKKKLSNKKNRYNDSGNPILLYVKNALSIAKMKAAITANL